MRKKIIGFVVGLAALSAAGGVALASGSGGGAAAGGSRLDDGKDLLGRAGITEKDAIKAAQGAATGDLNEVDLEQWSGKLVFNVDVGSSDVKVDAGSGKVLSVRQDD
ncbi:MAG: Peptidase propeptide and domain [Frankiaceae bacterium]|nr:Peptidase propeptide and domain [Frankiaceae bacterium]